MHDPMTGMSGISRDLWERLTYPCFNTWTPRTCRSNATHPAARIRSPIDHVCWTPSYRPHVCTCGPCSRR